MLRQPAERGCAITEPDYRHPPGDAASQSENNTGPRKGGTGSNHMGPGLQLSYPKFFASASATVMKKHGKKEQNERKRKREKQTGGRGRTTEEGRKRAGKK